MRIAFVGVGAMGRPMAAHLAQAPGIELVVYDASPAARLAAAGIGTLADSLAEAVADSEVVMTMLPADEHVLEVAATLAELGWEGRYFVDFSTVHPATIRRVAEVLAGHAATVSVSCMKSVAAAVAGELTLFVGGPDATDASLRALLEPVASQVLCFDTLEAAKALKLVNNLMVASTDLVLSEAAVVAAAAGVAHADFFALLTSRGIGGWALENHLVRHQLTGDLGPGNFSIRYMAKDVALAALMAEDSGVPRFLAGTILAAYRGTAALGLGDHYHPIVIRWLEASSGGADRSRPPGPEPAEVSQTLSEWARLAEWLITRHGLLLASANGVSWRAAAEALAKASAANGALAAVLEDRQDASGLPSPGPLDEALRVAATLEVPGLTMEAARDFRSALAQAGGGQ